MWIFFYSNRKYIVFDLFSALILYLVGPLFIFFFIFFLFFLGLFIWNIFCNFCFIILNFLEINVENFLIVDPWGFLLCTKSCASSNWSTIWPGNTDFEAPMCACLEADIYSLWPWQGWCPQWCWVEWFSGFCSSFVFNLNSKFDVCFMSNYSAPDNLRMIL